MRQRAFFVCVATIILGAVLLLARSGLPARIARVPGQALEAARHQTTEPETIPDNAVYQRFRRRREAVAAMRADLLRLVAAESAFAADSGHPTAFLPAAYGFPLAPGNVGPDIRLHFDGWSATIGHTLTPIRCSVTVAFDTTLTKAVVNGPVCVSPA